MEERITATATRSAAQDPHISRATSLNGASDCTNCPRGTTPSTTMVPSTYRRAATLMPRIVERGIVRVGSRTSPAGTVADSRPRYANMVSGASAAQDDRKSSPLGLNSARFSRRTKNRPASTMAAKGTSFEYVVIDENTPAALAPRRLTRTTAQMAQSVSATAIDLLRNCGITLMSAPAKAKAMTGREAQIDIQ